jgi:hypothetical protein
MKNALLFAASSAALLLLARGASAGDERTLCAEVANLVEARDFLGGQQLIDRSGTRDAHLLRARALLNALSNDFGFLSLFRGQYADEFSTCPRPDRERLEASLRARADRAHDLLRDARDLSPWDRSAADLILTWAAAGTDPPAAVIDELERGAEDHLSRFPESPYRRFLLSTLVHRYHPPAAAFELEGFGALPLFVGSSGRDLQANPGGGGGLAYLEGQFRIGLQALVSTARLRRDVPERGTDWIAGRRPSWFVVEATAGYRPTWGRHGGLAQLGLGFSQLMLARGLQPSLRLSYAQLSLAVGYDFAFRATQPPRGMGRGTEWHQPGLLLRAEVAGFGTAGEAGVGGLAPAGVLIRVGVVAEDRVRERVVE